MKHSSFFKPESPLGLEVQKILQENQAGLAFSEIKRHLRLRGKTIQDDHLRELLAHTHHFIALPDNKFCLRSSLQHQKLTETAKPVPTKKPAEPVYCANLQHATENYILLDTETTGLNPQLDKIWQLTAIRYEAGEPKAAVNYYFKVDKKVPEKLETKQVVLNATDLSERIVEFRDFIGNLPLIAHNIRFDIKFLNAAFGELTNPLVDTLELATLLVPAAPRHNLEELGKFFKLDFVAVRAIWQRAGQTEDYAGQISAEHLHDAVTDTCLLALVYRKLLDLYNDKTCPTSQICQILLPESRGLIWQKLAVETEGFQKLKHLLQVVANQWQPRLGETPAVLESSTELQTVENLLSEYCAAKNYPTRAGQTRMTQLVWQALDENQFKLIEAPTGTGKTIATLLPAIVKTLQTGERVVFSTAYRNLQDQLLGEIATIQSLTRLPFHFQVLKGISNYPCYKRLLEYLEQLSDSSTLSERYIVAYLLARGVTAPESTLDDLSYWVRANFEIANSIYPQITATKGSCTSGECRELACALLRATVQTKTAHLLLVNHDLWLADPERLPSFSYLILDEAHKLEDAATRATTREVSKSSLEKLLNALANRWTEQGLLARLKAKYADEEIISLIQKIALLRELCLKLVEDFQEHLTHFIKLCQGKLNSTYGTAFRLLADPRRVESTRWSSVEGARQQLFEIHLKELGTTLGQLAGLLKTSTNFRQGEQLLEELAQLHDELLEQLAWQSEILTAANLKYVSWLEVGIPEEVFESGPDKDSNLQELISGPSDQSLPKAASKHWALKAAPVRVADMLGNFYQKLESAVLVSATLSIRGGDFSFFVDRLGLEAYLGNNNTHLIEGDLAYAQNAYLGLANYFDYVPTEHTMNSYQQEFSDELKLLLDYTSGRALVLFTAKERLNFTYTRCADSLAQIGIPLYRQADNFSRRKLLEEFAARRESVLLGLQSFWEGVDVPGESLSFVIMEKLPFPFMFDPLFKARREDVLAKGQHEFADFIFPLMAIQFKQGFGRLLRKKDDQGAVILLDKRIHRKTYKYELLNSLPGFIAQDETAARQRRSFYLDMARKLPGVIDLDNKQPLLAGLPETLTTDFVRELKNFELPAKLSLEDYAQWREVLLEALWKLFRFKNFRSSEQEEIIKQILTGQDVLALLPTGAGKSLCFQLTALLRSGLTIVFSPLIALMRDQVQTLNSRGIEIVSAIYSGQAAAEREEILEQVRLNKLRLIYISPERLRDPQVLYSLTQAKIEQIVVDEAHCIAMWGPSFRPDFLYLTRLFKLLPQRPPVAAFTATATKAIREEICQALQLANPTSQVIASFDRPELRLVVYNQHSPYNRMRSKNDRLAILLKILEVADYERQSIIIYVATTTEAELLARRLQQVGYDARFYHGKMETKERANIQELFMDDHINIVVCTKAFGMGIDKPNIRYVIHYNTPGDLESYYQEAGRAGRDGQEAWCVLLYHPSDYTTQDYFIQANTLSAAMLQAVYTNIRRDSQGASVVYFNPQLAALELALDEVELKIALHRLEQQKVIERKEDFTIQGNLILLADSTMIVSKLAETAAAEAALFEQLCKSINLPFYRGINLHLVDLAASLQTSLQALEKLLIALAVQNLALYRPWEKGFILELKTGLTLLPPEIEAGNQNSAQTEKLTAMFRYAEASPGKPGLVKCRRAYILNYFDEEQAVSCGNCDLCNPDYEYPWSKLSQRDVAPGSAYYDIAFTLLQIAKWSADQTRYSGRPFGQATLLKILRSQAFVLGKYIADPTERARRLHYYRQCPYWGIFENLPNVEKELNYTINRLTEENYWLALTGTFDSESGSREYTFFELTEKGNAQLLSGKTLGWKAS